MEKVQFELEVYVLGKSAKSEAALENLRRFCDAHLRGQHEIVIIDVLEDPAAAERANVVATPTLIRRAPAPVRTIVGDFSRIEVMSRGLGIDMETGAAGDES